MVVHLLNRDPDLQVVAAVVSGNAALRHVQTACPDAVLLDHEMPDGAGLEVLPELRARCPRARIVLYSAADVAAQALAGGAHAFIGKDQALAEVADLLLAR